MNNDYLVHYGVVGMKWGVRRTPEQLGHRSESIENLKNHIQRSSGSRTSETLSRARKEDINKLSNEQLRQYNDRLNLERNYADLTKGNVGKAKDFVAKTIIGGVFVGAAAGFAKGLVMKFLKAKFGIG